MMEDRGSNRPATGKIHPAVLLAALALMLWVVAMAWILFASGSVRDLVYAVVAFFAVVSFGLPAAMAAMYRRRSQDGSELSLRDWLEARLKTVSGALEGKHAAVQILLMPASAALGFTLIGLAEVLVRVGLL